MLRMKDYRHLNLDERVKIGELRQSETSVSEIASALGRNKSTISRELRRNAAPPGYYWPDTAQNLAIQHQHRGCRLDKNPILREFVLDRLRYDGWTPEIIAGTLKTHGVHLGYVSHETIYAWIYGASQKSEKWWKFLVRHKAKRGIRQPKAGSTPRIPNRVSIHDRPASLLSHPPFGHGEADLMSFQKNSQHILVLRERPTMFTLSQRLPNKTACATAQALIQLMKPLPQRARRSITFDNGGEFAAHEKCHKQRRLKTYFCDPYASWQKGGIENTNGRLRRDLPRSTNIHQLSQEDFNETIDNYNETPRKNLAWNSPKQMFLQNLNPVALQT